MEAPAEYKRSDREYTAGSSAEAEAICGREISLAGLWELFLGAPSKPPPHHHLVVIVVWRCAAGGAVDEVGSTTP